MDTDRPEHPTHHPRGGDRRHQQPPASFHHQQGQDLNRAPSNRTLLDIIREEGGDVGGGRKKWKHFTDKLKPRRSSSFTSTVQVPTSDVPMMTRHGSFDRADQQVGNSSFRQATERPGFPSKRLQREDFSDEEEEDEEEGEEDNEEYRDDEMRHEDDDDGDEEEKQQPVKMSLMALLAENDGTSYMMDDDEDDEEDDDDDGGGEGGPVEYTSCCVCMVRHKGAAFIPCGHTFCRLCSRELWVQRGHCPLCNNYILEILDIY